MHTPRALALLAATLASSLSLLSSEPASEAILRAKVESLMSRMLLEDQVGQLAQVSSPSLVTGPEAQRNVEEEIRKGRVGAVLNYLGAERTRKLQEIAVRESRLGIPLLFGYDVVHGYRTIFPINLGQAASWDLAAIEGAERIAAIESSASGINWTFAPMVDIARDPRWGRIAEGSGEDPFLGAAIARARVLGFQGKELADKDTILACAKHFAGYGASQAGRDYWSTDMSVATLRDVYLPPFEAAVQAGAGSFMAGFNELNGVPCSANPGLLGQVLRSEWGFSGFVVSDWASVKELVAHGYASDLKEAASLAFNSGVDMDMEGGAYAPHLTQLVYDGEIPRERLRQAVFSILMQKARLGLLDDPFKYCDSSRERSDIMTAAHLAAARDLAAKSCVLLQNENGVLPLPKGRRIALVGPLSDATTDLLGPWHAQGQPEDVHSLKEVLTESGKNEIVWARGCGINDEDRSGIEEAVKVAKRSTFVVAVLGESQDMSGEAASRSELGLPGVQLELLKALRATGKPVVVVLLAGRPLVLDEVRRNADALLYAWFPGSQGAAAIVDLLQGKLSPSGKLPVTFPRSVGQIPLYYSGKSSGRPVDPAAPEAKFKSRYLDLPNTPEFPFGFGLSYTSFKYGAVTQDSQTLRQGGVLRIRVSVTNAGRMAGDEIVQLYVRDVVGAATRPVRELKGFSRVSLKPGETRELSFELRPEDLAFTWPDGGRRAEAGTFEFFVGGDSTAPKAGQFELQAR